MDEGAVDISYHIDKHYFRRVVKASQQEFDLILTILRHRCFDCNDSDPKVRVELSIVAKQRRRGALPWVGKRTSDAYRRSRKGES